MARTAKGNIIERMGKCPDCGIEFDSEEFRVKIHGDGPFVSYLCRQCAKEQGAEIIELKRG